MSDKDHATQETDTPGSEIAENKQAEEETIDLDLEIKLGTRRDAASDDEGSEADEGYVTGNHLFPLPAPYMRPKDCRLVLLWRSTTLPSCLPLSRSNDSR